MFDESYGLDGDHKENITVLWNWCIDTEVYEIFLFLSHDCIFCWK